jgi:LAS superfamily LD-carboxypeptidase LdcB
MKKISNLPVVKLLLLALITALLLTTVNAQAVRLNKRKLQKLEQQQPEEKSLAPSNPKAPQQNRPQTINPSVANPRLQAIVLDRFLPQIDLSQEQMVKIRTLRAQHVRRMQTFIAMERVHTKAYDEALFDPDLDQKEIEKRTAQLAEVRADLLNAQARFFIELRQVLTPEQFAKLRQLMEEERDRRLSNRP